MINYFLAVLISSAPAATVEKYLPEGFLACPYENQDVIEDIVENENSSNKFYSIGKAIYSGKCLVGKDFQVALNEIQTFHTPGGREYACFALQEKQYCSTISTIKDISEEIKTRKGDFKLLIDNPRLAKANCKEGGTVIIIKNEDSWERMSLVFPRPLDPVSRVVSQDADTALRDGCKGADYK